MIGFPNEAVKIYEDKRIIGCKGHTALIATIVSLLAFAIICSLMWSGDLSGPTAWLEKGRIGHLTTSLFALAVCFGAVYAIICCAQNRKSEDVADSNIRPSQPQLPPPYVLPIETVMLAASVAT